jgi:hypothetical protein
MGHPKTAEVVGLRVIEIGDQRRLPGKIVLNRARAQKLDDVLVIGRTDEGELWAASSLNAGQTLWLIEKLRERVLEGSPWGIV